MSSVDSRVVNMQFNRNDFAKGVSDTMSQLDQLKNSLKMQGATDGLNNLDAASKKVDFSPMADNAEKSGWRINAMTIAVGTAISTLSRQVFMDAENMVKSFTTAPISAGLESYTEQINATQTILANTQAAGTNLSDVTGVLAELQKYANQTVYSFSDMTKNIGTFTAAGVDLNTSVSAIKGIANLAAMSGSTSDQASSAMYQLSQAIAAGSVKLQDWNSVVNAGIGGKTFQNALIQTAKAHGIAVDQMIKQDGSFRESLQEGWITSSVLTDTLAQFTGDLSDAQLKAMGYTDDEVASIQKLGKTALASAVNIRTIPQMMQALKEEVATAYGAVFKTVFGDIDQATTLFTGMHNVLENTLTGPIYALNTLLQGWAALGGRAKAIDAFTNAFKALGAVVRPIEQAFHQIFPPETAKSLYDLTVGFDNFTKKLQPSVQTVVNLRRIFAGVFAVFDIGWQVVKQLTWVIGSLFGAITKHTQGSGGLLQFLAQLGDFAVKVDEAVKNGTFLTNFFIVLEKVLQKPIDLLKTVGNYILHLFDGFNGAAVGKVVGNLINALDPLGRMGDTVGGAWGHVTAIFDNLAKVFAPLAGKIQNGVENIRTALANAFSGITFDKVIATIQTGMLGGLLLMFKQVVGVIKNFGKGEKEVKPGFFDGIKESFEELTNTLKSMQQVLKAATLLEIAAALGILTVSVIELSRIDPKGLTRALTAITVMFVQLGAAMKGIQVITNGKGFTKEAASLILLASAIDILASAVTKMSQIPFTSMVKGLLGVTVLLRAVVTATKEMDSEKGGMITTATGMVLLASAIRILVQAVSDLGALSWKQLVKGLGSVGTLLASLALFTRLAAADKGGVLQGAGLILLAVGINILADAVAKLGKLSWRELVKGLGTVAGALVAIAVAMRLMPASTLLSSASILIVASALGLITDALAKMGGQTKKEIGKSLIELAGALGTIAIALKLMPASSILSAAAVLVVATSLGMLVDSLTTMGDMTKKQIGKSLIELAGALGIIAVAMKLMTGALAGAAALVVVTLSLKLLEPILVAFGTMSWGQIIKGLTMLAGVFVVVGVAGLVLAPIIPALLGLGAAIALLGVAVLAAGVGVLAFATGLTLLAAAGSAGAAAIVAIVSGLVGLLPYVAEQLGKAIIVFAQIIATSGPAILGAISAVLSALLLAIINNAPLAAQAFLALINAILTVLVNAVPELVDAGMKLLIGFLAGIANNIGGVVTQAVNIIVNFVNAIANNLPRIIQSGFNLIIAFMNGIGNAARANGPALADAGWNMGTGIIDGVVKGLSSIGGHILDALMNIVKGAWGKLLSWLGIKSPSTKGIEVGQYVVLGLAKGIDDNASTANDSVQSMGEGIIDTMGKSISGLGDLISNQMSDDFSPTVTPVLDLSSVQKDASTIGSLLTAQPLSVDSTVSAATDASAGYSDNQAAANTPVTEINQTNNFVQNNTSPKALSSVDIYRQTNNQISKAKGVLATSVNPS